MQTPEQIANAARDAVILAWRDKAEQLERLKAEELIARNAVAKLFSDPKEGTNTIALGNGYELKYVHSFNFNLSNSDKPKPESGMLPLATDVALDAIEKMGNEGKFIAERLVKWSPELSITEYRLLADDSPIKKAIDKALKISPAAPKITLVVPKA